MPAIRERKSVQERAKEAQAKLFIKEAQMKMRTIDSLMKGGYDSARKNRFNHASGYIGNFGDLTPDEAVLPDLDELRRLSRDAARNNPIAKGIINKVGAGTIGTGLTMRPSFNRPVLKELVGLTDDDIDYLQEAVREKWVAWSGSTKCDYSEQLDFFQMQKQIKYMESTCGESLVMMIRSDEGLKIRHMHPMQLATPPGKAAKDVLSGVEYDAEGCKVVAYHFIKDTRQYYSTSENYVRVTKVSADTDQPNVLHVFNMLEPGQTRGVPRLSSDLGYIKNIDRVNESNVIQEMVKSFFTGFITTTRPGDFADKQLDAYIAENGGDTIPPGAPPGKQVRLAAGGMNYLKPGEDIKFADPKTNTSYEAWLTAHLKILGMSQSIPFEVLMDAFQSSYSASRAARLAWRKYCEIERTGIVTQCFQPIYKGWLWTENTLGKMDLPGYFDDPRIAAAYENATWDGDAIGLLDPYQEAKAATAMVDGGFSTLAEQTSSLTGGDWKKNAHQRAEENRLYEQLSLFPEESGNEIQDSSQREAGNSQASSRRDVRYDQNRRGRSRGVRHQSGRAVRV